MWKRYLFQSSETIPRKLSYATTIATTGVLVPNLSPMHHDRKWIFLKFTNKEIPLLIFNTKDYYEVMEEECVRTIVAYSLRLGLKFRKFNLVLLFLKKILEKGRGGLECMINLMYFMYLNNNEYVNMTWFRKVIEIEKLLIRLRKGSPNFKPKEDLPIALKWALLPQLTFHMHNWCYRDKLLMKLELY